MFYMFDILDESKHSNLHCTSIDK